MQTESYTSTVSHEMRTPLFSTIFFLQQIMSCFLKSPFPIEKVPQINKYCKLMMSQLILLQTFVEDLLDLR